MRVSVVIRTKDEAGRLRLTLTALTRQTVPAAEVIVTDDASTDETAAVLAEAAADLPLQVLRHEQCLGRSAASNAGARRATGDVLLFLDGDTLPGPDVVARHAACHTANAVVGRGETYHLRCTRFFRDPETGTPQPGQEEQVRRLGPDFDSCRVTRAQVRHDFAAIDRRAQPGIYPGSGPRQLFDLEWRALRERPDLTVLWMAVSGHNLSVPRTAFELVGGFDDRLTINEHRELAFRLQEHGWRLAPVAGARTYHLTHRSGWRNPLTEPDWERLFFEAHPCLAVRLMPILWRSLAHDPTVPPSECILSLEEMDARVRAGE